MSTSAMTLNRKTKLPHLIWAIKIKLAVRHRALDWTTGVIVIVFKSPSSPLVGGYGTAESTRE